MDSAFLPRPHKRCPDDDGDSKLHRACFKGAYESALMLILSGEDIMARNVWNQTPLHHCTSQGHLDVMLLLLDSGASVNALDHDNLTPLHMAIIHSNKHAAQLLLCYGASIHNQSSVTDATRSVLELASHVHVCHKVVQEAAGRVWPLQHLCRIAVRQSLGAARRKRMKELPVPKRLLSYLCSLPVDMSNFLHQNWERVRSNKCEAIRKKGASRRMHQRLDFEVLSISAGQRANMRVVVGERGSLARDPDKKVDDASNNDQLTTASRNNGGSSRDGGTAESENRDRRSGRSENRDRETAGFEVKDRETAGSEVRNRGTDECETRDQGTVELGSRDRGTAESEIRDRETAESGTKDRDVDVEGVGESGHSQLGGAKIVAAVPDGASTDDSGHTNSKVNKTSSSIRIECESVAAVVYNNNASNQDGDRQLNSNNIDNEDSIEPTTKHTNHDNEV